MKDYVYKVKRRKAPPAKATKGDWAVILVFIVLASWLFLRNAGQNAISNFHSNHPATTAPAAPPQADITLEDQMRENAAEITNEGPKMIDSNTRIDSAFVSPGLVFNYVVTLVNFSSTYFDKQTMREAEPDMRKAICETESIAPLLNAGVTFSYIYHGNDGVEVNRISVNRSSCNSSISQSATAPSQNNAFSMSDGSPAKHHKQSSYSPPKQVKPCELKQVMTDEEIQACRDANK